MLPITSLGLDHPASTERISTGIPRLDAMLGGKGYFRGSSILVSGTAGTGKTSLAAPFADAACRRGERVPLLRLRGIARPDHPQHALHRHRPGAAGASKGLLRFHAARPTLYGLEMHLATMHKLVDGVPARRSVIIDPITNLLDGRRRARRSRRC